MNSSPRSDKHPLDPTELPAALSPREHEVLGLIVAGRVDREIATALGVSPRTVATHVRLILAKLGAPNRAAAVAAAIRRGLV